MTEPLNIILEGLIPDLLSATLPIGLYFYYFYFVCLLSSVFKLPRAKKLSIRFEKLILFSYPRYLVSRGQTKKIKTADILLVRITHKNSIG